MTTAPAVESPQDWRWQHAHALTSLDQVEQLFGDRFDLSGLDRGGIEAAIARYGMRSTPYYLGLAAAASEADPVWALAVPSPRELAVRPEEHEDPIGDELPELHPLRAITRRYPDRALLYPTPTCSVHCRHCFRKRMVGNADYAIDEAGLDEAVAWITEQTDLREVILTGGDPLTLSDSRLLALLRRLDAVPHLRGLRIHTRMPVVNPFRVTEELAAGLAALRRPLIVVAHFNHPVELTAQARQAAWRLVSRGIAVLNQSVLLAGINDRADTHRELLWALAEARIRPYALHQADLVPGTAHLRTTIRQGQALMAALRGTVPGHMLPVWLLDVPGGHGKLPLEDPWVQPGVLAGQRWEAPGGARHGPGGPTRR